MAQAMIPEALQQDPIVSALADLATTAKFEFNELTIEIDTDAGTCTVCRV